MSDNARQRLFFALWPPADLQQALVSLRDDVTAEERRIKPVLAQNLHLTLAFLGATGAATRGCYEQAAERVRGVAPFSISLDTIGYWRRGGILWIGASVAPPLLRQLYDTLVSELQKCGFQPEARVFAAHITIVRNMRRAPPRTEMPPLTWSVADFSLVESVTYPEGAQYQVLRRWHLSD